jgi:hypothetical protein
VDGVPLYSLAFTKSEDVEGIIHPAAAFVSELSATANV